MFEPETEKFEKFKELYEQWLSGDRAFRIKKDLYESIGISEKTGVQWSKRVERERSPEDNFQKSLADLDEKALAGLKRACERGSPAGLQLFYKLTNRYIEKKEETVKLEYSPAERIADAREFIEGLRAQYKGGYCPLCQRPWVLPDQTCVDTEREYPEDGQVAAVVVPD